MRKFFLSLITLSFYFISNAQITKGNWLIGGSISFSKTKLNNDLGGYTEKDINAVGDLGYFFLNNIVTGIRPNLFFSKTKYNNTNVSTRSEIGPFLRYYFLPVEQRINLFIDGSYSYGFSSVKFNTTTTNKVSSNDFSIMGGPVIFLNTAVAIELSIGYNSTTFNDGIHSKKNVIMSGIGLQFYLEKND